MDDLVGYVEARGQQQLDRRDVGDDGHRPPGVPAPAGAFLRPFAERAGVPPKGEHVVVVAHRPADDWPHAGTAPFTFVPDVRTGIEQARALAGDRNVTVSAGDVGGQALRAGLVDRVVLALVPVVLGSGKPYFGAGGPPEIQFEDPQVVQGSRVTHLVYDVRR